MDTLKKKGDSQQMHRSLAINFAGKCVRNYGAKEKINVAKTQHSTGGVYSRSVGSFIARVF